MILPVLWETTIPKDERVKTGKYIKKEKLWIC